MDAADLPESIKTDEQRLQQVLKNLLSNAFKFTEQGKVILQVKRADKAMKFDSELLNQTDNVLAFSVIDTGIGIPKNKQKLIFEAFQQADGTTSRKYGGTGLGLTISREIARLLGGEIQVESAPGKGSRFTFYLPESYSGSPIDLREGRESKMESAALPAQATSTIIGPELAGKQILVIDDDVRNIFAVTSMLETYGMKVVFAENGKDGIEALKKNEGIDVVLVDVMMPEMDGYETTRTIRRIPKYKSLPIIALTAKAMKGDREKCIAAGVSDYITKPANNDQLLSMIKVWLERTPQGKKG
jgi:two-component system chemotaxis sensor kinase CheA